MFSKLMRAVCVLLAVTHTGLGVVALRAGNWPGVLEAFAVTLLAFVLWFAAPPGAAALERPRFGTRAVRFALYYVSIALAAVSGLSFFWAAASAPPRQAGGSLLLLLIVFLVPVVQAELRERVTP